MVALNSSISSWAHGIQFFEARGPATEPGADVGIRTDRAEDGLGLKPFAFLAEHMWTDERKEVLHGL